MPGGDPPPDPGLPETVFNAIKAMAYNAASQAFSSGGSLYFMYVEQIPSTGYDRARWWQATTAQGANKPKALVPQATYTVVHNGTFNRTNETIRYNNQNYRIRLAAPAGGALIAEAHVVAV